MNKIIQGDTLAKLKELPDNLVDTIVTSPPYWGLRDYGVAGQIGLEKTLEEYIVKLLAITQELKRVLKPSGVFFLNHGDCYSGNRTYQVSQTKTPDRGKAGEKFSQGMSEDRAGVPANCLALQNYRLILRMIDDQGWILRNIIQWHKPNHMPSSVKDRFANSYEPVFMLVKQQRYWFDLDAVRIKVNYPEDVARRIKQDHEAGVKPFQKGTDIARHRKTTTYPHSRQHNNKDARGDNYGGPGSFAVFKSDNPSFTNPAGKNPGDVWTIPTQPFPKAHFATFPEKLVEPMIKAGCPKNGIALDPFMGAGTVGVVAKKLGRQYLGIELNPDYIKIAEKRLLNTMGRLI